MFTRDISKAYTQSDTCIQSDVFVVPPVEFRVDETIVLNVKRPLYGLPEAGVHWFATSHRHHVQRLHMQDSAQDKCLLWTERDSPARGIVCLQVDDSPVAGDKTFVKLEQMNSGTFKSRQLVFLGERTSLVF